MTSEQQLLTPGPTTIPQRILRAMELPRLHHRSEEFKKEFRDATDGLRWLLGWDSDPLMLACSGSGAMEASLLNTTKPGDEIVTVSAGVFGQRWKAIGERLGLIVHEMKIPWGDVVTKDTMAEFISSRSNIRAVCMQHCETSTTALHPLHEVLPIIRQQAPSAVTIVDGISSCVTTPLPGDSSLIDIYIAGSQKAFMLPPGLSMVALSQSAWKRVEQTPKRSLYFDFELARESLKTNQTPWTPATTLVVGLNEAIRIFKEEGLEHIYKRHSDLSALARKVLTQLGLRLVVAEHPSPSVTGFYPPSGMSADNLRKVIFEQHGIRLAGGQGLFKKEILRIGHMGLVEINDLVAGLQAIINAIHDLGGSLPSLNLEQLAQEYR
jgi:aspartate aminotransferase-like enzyme